MNQSVEETKRRLSDVSGYRHHLDGVESVDFSGRGESKWRLMLPLGFRSEFSMTAVESAEANTFMFQSHGGDLEIVGMVTFQAVKAGLTEIELTVNYESTSPLFNVLDRMLNVGDHFLINQLRRIRAHFEGIAAPAPRREVAYSHQFKTATV